MMITVKQISSMFIKSNTMLSRRLSRRSRFYTRRLKTGHYLLFLILAFFSALITFLITLYFHADHVMALVDYLLSSQSNELIKYPVRSRIGEHYQGRDFPGKARSIHYDYYIQYKDFNFEKPESLTYTNRTYTNQIQILYRLPRRTSLAALLLIFHACNDSASDWFHTPERQRIIGAAIDLGYGCLVFQSTDKTNGCWANEVDVYENRDIQMITQALHDFYTDFPALVSLPRFTFGSSSGGIFSSIFALNQKYDIHGQILFASIILPHILYTYVKSKNYPPTVWIHMLRDVEFASESRINVSKKVFLEQQIPFNSLPIEPTTLTHSLFHERIPSVTPETSRFLIYQLQLNHWVNTFNYLKYNPRRKLTWQPFLFPSTAPSKSDALYKNLNDNRWIISQFLNTIYGEHEISYERSFEALKWLREIYLKSRNKTDWIT